MEQLHSATNAIDIDGSHIRYHINNGRIAIPGIDVNKWVELNWSGNMSVYSDPKLRNKLEAELFGKVYHEVEKDH
jgi:hypothetical protein